MCAGVSVRGGECECARGRVRAGGVSARVSMCPFQEMPSVHPVHNQNPFSTSPGWEAAPLLEAMGRARQTCQQHCRWGWGPHALASEVGTVRLRVCECAAVRGRFARPSSCLPTSLLRSRPLSFLFHSGWLSHLSAMPVPGMV